MSHSIEELLQQTLAGLESFPVIYQLLFFYVMAFIQIAFGLPGDVALMLGSFLGSVVRLPGGSWTILLSYYLGTCTGGYTLFELGRRGGARILKRPWAVRLLGEKNLDEARRITARRGNLVFLFSKFIPGVNGMTLLMGGALGLDRVRSYGCIAAAALAHNLLLFLAGRAVGSNLDQIAAFLQEYSVVAVTVMSVVLAAAIALLIVRRRRKTRQEDAP